MKHIKSVLILSALSLASIFTACDKFENDVPPVGSSQLIVHDDTLSTKKNIPLQFNVLANDSLGSQATLQFGQPQHGTIQTGNDGSVSYKPALNFVGTDRFNYVACIGSTCATGIITILVSDSVVNTCIVSTKPDTATVKQNQQVTINVLQNDNACSDSLRINSIPMHGFIAQLPNQSIVYTPNPNYAGPDQFTYKLVGAVNSGIEMVRINVTPNQPGCMIRANPDSAVLIRHLGTPMDTVMVKVLANDIDCYPAIGPAPTITVVSQGNHGNAFVINMGIYGSVIAYSTTTTTKNITDIFQYRICKGNSCSTSYVKVRIQ